MQRSKLCNRLNQLKTPETNADYKRQRNYCTSLLRRTKRDFFEKLNPNAISLFVKTMKFTTMMPKWLKILVISSVQLLLN